LSGYLHGYTGKKGFGAQNRHFAIRYKKFLNIQKSNYWVLEMVRALGNQRIEKVSW
jgi:hypothetical protein